MTIADNSPSPSSVPPAADVGLPELSEEQLAEGDPTECFTQVAYLEEQLRTMAPDLGAIEEYKRKEEEYGSKHDEMKAVTEERDAVGGSGRSGAWRLVCCAVLCCEVCRLL